MQIKNNGIFQQNQSRANNEYINYYMNNKNEAKIKRFVLELQVAHRQPFLFYYSAFSYALAFSPYCYPFYNGLLD